MKQLLIILFSGICIGAFAQKSITFKIEDKSKPDNLLPESSIDSIYRTLIQKDAHIDEWEITHDNIAFDYKIYAQSKVTNSLVNYEYNSFFYGMYEAYAHHRPFVLSPDMIWLLICQGFAHHVNAEPEKLRSMFVSHEGKLSLVVRSNEISLNSPPEDWEKIFPQFTKKIAEHTGDELMNTLTANFSTTTPVEKVATEITAMYAMKPYFEFIVISTICGIPEITIEGTPEDWQKVLDKTKQLEKYDLAWWTTELEPLLKQFVRASKGRVDKDFWRNMFKYHTLEEYGAPDVIDGWIVKFFPYDKDGNRNTLKELNGGRSLPDEIVKVDLKYLDYNGGLFSQTPLELWAGFVGLEQNSKTFALRPKIAWMIKRKDSVNTSLMQKIEKQNIPNDPWNEQGIALSVDVVPEELRALPEIYSLSLYFKKQVIIPDWLKKMRIGKLTIDGQLTNSERDSVTKWFQKSDLTVNNVHYAFGNKDCITVNSKILPKIIVRNKYIWVLEILHNEYHDGALTIPDELGTMQIENIVFAYQISSDAINKIKKLLPNTKIYVERELVR